MSPFEQAAEAKRFTSPQDVEGTVANAMNQLEYLYKESPDKIAKNLDAVLVLLDRIELKKLSADSAKKLMMMLAKAQPRPPVEKNPKTMQEFIELTVKQGRYLNTLKDVANRPPAGEIKSAAERPASTLIRKPRPERDVKVVPGITKALDTIHNAPDAREEVGEDWTSQAKRDVGRRTEMKMRAIKKTEQPSAPEKGFFGKMWDSIRGRS